MIFKEKKLFSFTATIMIVFAVLGVNGCSEGHAKKIDISYVIDDSTCPYPSWTYTDIVKNYHCNAYDNFEGDTNSTPPVGFEVAGLCTTVITNLGTPTNLYEDVFKDNIIVDCSSGALTSFDYITFLDLIDRRPPLRLGGGRPSEVLTHAQAGNQISMTVTCDVQGQTRDTETYIFTTPINGTTYHDVCITVMR